MILSRVSDDTYYVDIIVSHDVDFSVNNVLSVFFAKFHRKTCEIDSGKFGIAFPHYCDTGVGNVIRVFSANKNLQILIKSEWKGISDFLSFKEIRKIPIDVNNYVLFKRKQINTFAKQRKRLVSHFNLSEAEALARIPVEEDLKKYSKLPYINVKSLSTNSMAKIFVERISLMSDDISEDLDCSDFSFSTYGFSSIIALPDF